MQVTASLIQEMATVFGENASAGHVNESQYAVVLKLADGSKAFVATEPHPAVLSNPSQVLGQGMARVVASAVFRAWVNGISFRLPKDAGGAILTLHDAITIDLAVEDHHEQWVMHYMVDQSGLEKNGYRTLKVYKAELGSLAKGQGSTRIN